MSRSRRSTALTLVLALMCASLVAARPPSTAQAAQFNYVVDLAADLNLATSPQITCTTAQQDKDCTLRKAMELANSDGGTSDITFDIPDDSGVPEFGYNDSTRTWTIQPTIALPELSAGTTSIIGMADQFTGAPSIVIDGTNVSATEGVGFSIRSSGNRIERLTIINFKTLSSITGIGIRIYTPSEPPGQPRVTNNRILGNFIGARPSDQTASPNQRAGIQIDQADQNIIGDTTNLSNRNIISGNGQNGGGAGIILTSAFNNTIQGNYIGIHLAPGPFKLGNQGNGIEIVDSQGNLIGGTSMGVVAPRNYIGDNKQNGILLTGSNTRNNTLAGNFIGTDNGMNDVGNTLDGVLIANGANSNTISGNTSIRSVIGGNGGYGVQITDNGTSNNKILGAYIGVRNNGNVALANDLGGVRVQNNAGNNTIGGSGAGQGNLISGNKGYGISFGRTNTGFTNIFSNTIAANIIGLRFDGTLPISNTLGGILIDSGSRNNRVGGSSAAEQNVIAGNGGPGVVISGTATLSNTVAGNIIGLRRAAPNGAYNTPAGNTGDGVLVTGGARFTRVGGTTAEGNIIAANTGNGVRIAGTGTTTTTVQSNQIGTLKSGNSYLDLGNLQNGILVEGGARGASVISNTIYYNDQSGARVKDTGTLRVRIVNNSISRNGQGGIDLTPDGAGGGGDPNNPNHDINPPISLRLNQAGRLTGRVLNSLANQADSCLNCLLQIFAADPAALDSQGRDKLVETTIDAGGYFTATVGSGLPKQIAVTATDKDGNTSEFAIFNTRLGLNVWTEAAQNAFPGQVVTYTHRISNTGTIDFENDLEAKGNSTLGWGVKVEPTGKFSLPAGQEKPITLTLTLPNGPDARVLAGRVDLARVTVTSTRFMTITDSLTDTTTVQPKFLLSVSPQGISGLASPKAPNNVIRYAHTLVNTGNITTTVTITATTIPGWPTSVSPTSIQLAPGNANARSVTVSVTVPNPDIQAGTIARTTVRVTVPSDSTQNKVFTDTTTVELEPSAIMISDQEDDAGAGQVSQFIHTVENRSNGPATFRLNGTSSQGNQIRFIRVDGIAFGPDNSFTLDNTPGQNRLNFIVEITINERALPGTRDVITISLLDDQNRVRATVQDRINITNSPVLPRLYLPIIAR